MRFLLPTLALVALSACTCNTSEPPVEDGCVSDDECEGDETCVEGACVGPEECSLDAPCGDGTACVADEDRPTCQPITGDGDVNDACGGDVECASGACSGDVCVNTCTLDDGCVAGLRCVLDGPRRVCVPPTGNGAEGDGCDDARDCASGTCVRAPGAADALCAGACDADHPCEGDTQCLALDDGGRACLPRLGDGVACTGNDVCAGGRCIEDVDGAICASACVDDACDEGFVCVDDDGGDRLCVPRLDDRADGEACDNARQCASTICGNFGDPLGELCAAECPDPAAERGGCPVGDVCYDGDDVDLCGPDPAG